MTFARKVDYSTECLFMAVPFFIWPRKVVCGVFDQNDGFSLIYFLRGGVFKSPWTAASLLALSPVFNEMAPEGFEPFEAQKTFEFRVKICKDNDVTKTVLSVPCIFLHSLWPRGKDGLQAQAHHPYEVLQETMFPRYVPYAAEIPASRALGRSTLNYTIARIQAFSMTLHLSYIPKPSSCT